MITQNRLNNIHKLPLDDVRLILDECIGAIGLVDVETAKYALCVNRSRIYQLMNDETSYSIGKHKYLMINTIKN